MEAFDEPPVVEAEPVIAPAPPVDEDDPDDRLPREIVLEALLRNLLEEVSLRDAQRRHTRAFCAGCKAKPLRHFRACVEAWAYLDIIDRKRQRVNGQG